MIANNDSLGSGWQLTVAFRRMSNATLTELELASWSRAGAHTRIAGARWRCAGFSQSLERFGQLSP